MIRTDSPAMIALCTVPDVATAEEITRALLEDRLCACVNRLPGVQSTYRWAGQICNDEEWLLIIKTIETTFDALVKKITSLHPYDTCEVVALDIAAGNSPYLTWLEQQCAPPVDDFRNKTT